APMAGMDLEATVTSQVRGVIERLSPGNAAAAGAVVEAFLEDSRRLLGRNRPLLERLARRYRLGVVSNFYGNLDAVLGGERLGGLFGVVADSARVGSLKPDKGIFEYALSALGAAPPQALMVGDSLPRDMRGAEAAGLEHAWLSGPQGSSRAACCPRAWVLSSLLDLEVRLEEAARVGRR
ncbi:MAG: HAD-IA family hydrolase, partial [Elusimicrobiota bacterium]